MLGAYRGRFWPTSSGRVARATALGALDPQKATEPRKPPTDLARRGLGRIRASDPGRPARHRTSTWVSFGALAPRGARSPDEPSLQFLSMPGQESSRQCRLCGAGNDRTAEQFEIVKGDPTFTRTYARSKRW